MEQTAKENALCEATDFFHEWLTDLEEHLS
jgi:hypothetical protein